MQGPYAGERELPAGMWLLKVKTLEEAPGWAERYGKILSGTLEVDLRVVEQSEVEFIGEALGRLPR